MCECTSFAFPVIQLLLQFFVFFGAQAQLMLQLDSLRLDSRLARHESPLFDLKVRNGALHVTDRLNQSISGVVLSRDLALQPV